MCINHINTLLVFMKNTTPDYKNYCTVFHFIGYNCIGRVMNFGFHVNEFITDVILQQCFLDVR